ncbi:MAG: hypothetical protein C7B46_16460 [Sulfobacillus benefaciens]|uniref:Flagellar motor switch protein FliN-like C-terminal domain-containing protein n=1 Tax=Sulfobacillus benefaciens TaxID=453960 RepID=A0A2T2XBS8_9FIRM|nr:MAG: hypothetical protein C7B46_16460 [Sulfobacillus benefaciens]
MAEDNGPMSQADIDALLAALAAGASTAPKMMTPVESLEVNAQDTVETPAAQPLSSSKAVAERFKDPRLRPIAAVPMKFRVVLGHQTLTVEQALQLGENSRVVLDCKWQEPVALTLNGRVVGKGNVVLVGNRFGVQVVQWGTEGASPQPSRPEAQK